MDETIKNYNPLLQVDLVEGSLYWASYLINGDASGLSDREVKLCDAWLDRIDGEVVDVRRNADGDSDASFSWRYGQATGDTCSGGDLVDYVVHRHGPFAPPEGRVYEVVHHFDVWGHSSDECCEAYDCDCVDGDEHDDDACECRYEVNDSRRIGLLFVPKIDVFERDLVTLLRDHMEFNGASEDYAEEEPGDLININEKDGKPVLTLTPVD